MANQTQKLHIAMLPWPAFGHMIPFLDLAKNIAQKGHRVSYLATPRNIQRLPKLPPYLADSITLVQLLLHNDNGLPENAEATMDIPPHNMLDLKRAYHGLQEDVLLSSSKILLQIGLFTTYLLTGPQLLLI